MGFVVPHDQIQIIAAILVLVLVDTLSGIALAIKQHRFDVHKLANFVVNSVLPYGGGSLAYAVVVDSPLPYQAQMQATFYVIELTVAAKIIADIGEKWAQFGMPALQPPSQGSGSSSQG